MNRTRHVFMGSAAALSLVAVGAAFAHHGWSGYQDAIQKVGTQVSVEGYQHKTDPGEMRAERITVDGKTVELR